MLRWLWALTALAVLLLAAPGSSASDTAFLLSAALAALLVAAVLRLASDVATAAPGATASGPAADERCLRGSFRRQSSPACPGRPCRPRAPGSVPRPA
jgi:hypothetical protein